jgi:carbon-monoxide dehydrogenase small subunit
MTSTRDICVTVNGETFIRTVAVNLTLLEFLRNEIELTGTKEGCNEGECGACTVLMDGKPVNSCLVLAVEAHKKAVLTVEGLSCDGKLHPVQLAFAELGAVQCGYCTPGMLMSAVFVLERYPNPTDDEIRKGIEGNICRCAGYSQIIDAIKAAAGLMSAQGI